MMGDIEEEKPLVLEVNNERVWHSRADPQECCIYRVPDRLRRVNPEAYTPQMLILGPLHHSKKAEAAELAKQKCVCDDVDKIKSRYLDYLNMEQQKQIYLHDFAQRAGSRTIEEFESIIKSHQVKIRASYAESTVWIESSEFVDMILHDSVFIIEFFLKSRDRAGERKMSGDLLVDKPCLQNTAYEDLILLENQLPYFILEKLSDSFFPRKYTDLTFRQLVFGFFDIEEKQIKDNVEFRHFTDLFRRIRVETLDGGARKTKKNIRHLYNADKLDSSGVVFKAIGDNENSIKVSFENKCLYMSCLTFHDVTEMILRNVMALEQCHYPYNTYVCNYIMFLDFLIDTDKDVDLLVEKGIIKNWIGYQGSIASMVNKLCIGVVEVNSCYSSIAKKLNLHHKNFWNKTKATLRRVYFTNLWKGTATIAGVVLLVLSLIQTVASVMQVMQNEDKSKSPPPPPFFR